MEARIWEVNPHLERKEKHTLRGRSLLLICEQSSTDHLQNDHGVKLESENSEMKDLPGLAKVPLPVEPSLAQETFSKKHSL